MKNSNKNPETNSGNLAKRLSQKKTWDDPELSILSVDKTKNGTGSTWEDGPPSDSYS
jgi:hypothetical protein